MARTNLQIFGATQTALAQYHGNPFRVAMMITLTDEGSAIEPLYMYNATDEEVVIANWFGKGQIITVISTLLQVYGLEIHEGDMAYSGNDQAYRKLYIREIQD